MESRVIGKSGLRVSVVGLGCNNFGGRLDLAGTRAVVDRALDLGITLLDTADTYGNQGGSESLLGEVLGSRRKSIVLASKFAKPMDKEGKLRGGSKQYVRSAIEASLTRLKTDWIDLYQMHEPDPKVPIDETLATLDALKQEGKIRAYGCSNFAAGEVRQGQESAQRLGVDGFVSFQDEYSLLNRTIEHNGLMAAASGYGMSLLPFYPLASGLLTGKYRRDIAPPPGTRLAANVRNAEKLFNDTNWRKVDALRGFCQTRGHSLLELAFSWLAGRSPVASVIAGATKPEQVEANVKAASWKLSAEDMAEVDRITAP